MVESLDLTAEGNFTISWTGPILRVLFLLDVGIPRQQGHRAAEAALSPAIDQFERVPKLRAHAKDGSCRQSPHTETDGPKHLDNAQAAYR